MQRYKFAGLSLILALVSSCNPGSKLKQGDIEKSEAYPSSADGEPIISSQTVAWPAADVPAEKAADEMPAEPEMKDEEQAGQVAAEPVPIGGAYLTCRYQTGQTQGAENYRMDCDISPVTEVKTLIAKAEFFKLDAQGNRTPLTLLNQDLLALKWTVQETAATLPYNRVQIVLSALNAISVSLTTTIATPLTLTRSAAFWLGGEPSNTVLANADEDCVEFSNAAMKISHQNTTGLVTGPLGRMNDIACSTRYNFLCRNTSAGATAAKWIVSNAEGAFADAARSCPQGYSFGLPVSEAEVREVNTMVDRTTQAMNIWVNMSDRTKENEFAVLYR